MITINLEKAVAIAHDKRREARAAQFAPLDEIIAKRIPIASIEEIEADRQAIRDADAALQAKIDAAKSVDDLLRVAAPILSASPAQAGA